MQRIVFSRHRQKILEFAAEELQFAQQQGGLMLTGAGEISFQDTPLLEQFINHSEALAVTLLKDSETVLDARFNVTFFSLEHDSIAVLLQEET